MNTAYSFPPHIPTFPRSRMFNILSYSPQAGQSGTTVTIDTLFNNISWRHDVHIRIVIGHKPIHTEIKCIGGNIPNLWRCTGFIPEFEVHKDSSIHTVNVTIQAVDKRNAVLDTITFGHFTYREHDFSLFDPGVVYVPHRGSTHLSAPQQHTAVPLHQGLRSRTSSASLEYPTSTQPPPGPKRKLCRHRDESDSGIDFEPVSLVFATKPSLADLGENLAQKEKAVGRRLVRFDRKVVGNDIHVTFRGISPEEYNGDRLFAVSCIYYKLTSTDSPVTWYTSVDMIRLVEHIVGGPFTTEEKSRIRRNFESLSPTTVSRTGNPPFFHHIMNFPPPKPRSIEKDIKVFRWKSLEAGLKKVMEKYSWVPDPDPSSSFTANPRSPHPESRDEFQNTLHHPAPHHHLATIASSEGAYSPNHDLVHPQPHFMVSNMLVDPRWLQHHHGDRFGLAVASPFASAAIPSPASIHAPPGHLTPAGEVGNDNHMTNSFPIPDLDLIASPGHIVCGLDPMVDSVLTT